VASPVVVLVIDQESYRTPPFKDSPTVTWTRELARVLAAVVNGGARVVGFDVVFQSSIEQSEIPFGEEPIGARMKGFDRDFLRALRQASDAGKIVLGEVQGDHPERPFPGQIIAARPQNIRALNVHTDSDDVIRRLPLAFTVDGKPVPLLAVELASRALGVTPEFSADGTTRLGGYAIPSAVPNTFTLNFHDDGRDIPVFSFADLHGCVGKDDSAFFRRAFDGRVVILGTVLNFEDRKLTSMRLSGGYDGTPAARCTPPAPVLAAARKPRSDIAGVLIHATAVRNLIEHDVVSELGFPWRSIIAILFAVVIAVAACLLAPTGAVLAWLALAAVHTACAVGLFVHALALPVAEPALAGLAALALMTGYRFVVADREERFLRRSFAFYLAPQVIDTMVASGRMPTLGGEMRNVTVFFSDLAGFSSTAERMTPAELVSLMNEYLSAMTDIIESHGGYVDKYIGDSIVAVFGAPVDDPEHAGHAVRAALSCRDRLDELNRSHAAFRDRGLAQRIGLNTGEAVVGNIGSRRRFNYTVMSDTVNVASRLEGANKYYGTSIMASEMTAAQAGLAFTWREIDTIRVQGRDEPIGVYEPLAAKEQETAEQGDIRAAYARGLECWRARDFAGAAEWFGRTAGIDPPAARFHERAKDLAANPPPADWTPVRTLEGK
jgi:adenylate cyclase